MSNAAAVIALTYDATDVQQDPMGIFLEIVQGLNDVPSVRGSDTIVPALTGRIARNRVKDRWELELRGYVAGTGTTEADARSSFRDLVTTIQTLFDPTVQADLVAELENGDIATIAARTLTTAWDQVVPSMARVSIVMEAVQDWDIVPAGS